MRWKLMLIGSLLSSVVGAGATLAVVFGSARRLATPDLIVFITLVIPIAAIIFASIFVYRHTARRRALQAMATALLACLLTLTILALASVLFPKPNPVSPSSIPPRTVE